MKKSFYILFFTVFIITQTNAQRSYILKHELGGAIGVSNFQSDFTPEGPLDGKIAVNGVSFEASHYLHILKRSYRGNNFYKYTVLKSSLTYASANFNNEGLADPSAPLSNGSQYSIRNTPTNVLLAKINSESNVLGIEGELQFYFNNIINFLHRSRRSRKNITINPYITLGLGFHYINSSPTYSQEAISLEAGWNVNRSETSGQPGYPDNYYSDFIQDTNTVTLSAKLGFGARYKLNKKTNLFAQIATRYYLSDWVDGLNPELVGNEFNDYNTVINVGIIRQVKF